MKVKPGKKEEFLQAMRSLTDAREKHEGLKKSALYRETDDRTGFSLIYEWETKQDLEKYTGAEKFKVLLGALKVLCEKSEISYGKIPAKLRYLSGGV